MRVLIVGGYGGFGGRLARLLAEEPRLALIVAGRSRTKAERFIAALPPGAGREPAVFDRDGNVAEGLRALGPTLLIDASGPWQAYGPDPYRLPRACIAAGVSYADLADDPAFVTGVAALDAAARAAGVWALSGLSTFPALTAAAVRRLAAGLDSLDSVEGGIAPSPYADVGLNVLRAVSGYAGKPVRRLQHGVWTAAPALVDSRRFSVAPPGALPLNSRRFSLFEVPDLQLLPALVPSLRTVWLGAAPAPPLLHRALCLMAGLVALRLLPSLRPFAGLFHWASARFRWGEHRGGMIVRIRGSCDGAPVERTWSMLAEGDVGPLIPSMAAEAMIRRTLDARPPPPGARHAAADLELDDYEAPFARHAIVSGVRETLSPDAPLYRRILGESYARLPPAVQVLHDRSGAHAAVGEAAVERGRGLLSRLVAALVGFPPAGRAVPLRVDFESRDGRELWTRRFGERVFRSAQSAGDGRSEHLLVERFGPLRFAMALVVEGDRLTLVIRRFSAFGLPLPLALAARSQTHETQDAEGRFRFDVRIDHPLTGLIVAYRGWLAPADGALHPTSASG